MSRLLILAALAPLAVFVLGAQASHVPECHLVGGATVVESSKMVGLQGTGRADGLYVHASDDPSDGTSGLWAETNDRPGLQVTDQWEECGSARAFKHARDEMVMEYLPSR